jgi:two-component system phosphate regulon sensor histidine kinase PhoR
LRRARPAPERTHRRAASGGAGGGAHRWQRFRLVAANPAVASLLPSLRPGELLVRGLRSPDILDAITRAFAARKPQKVQWRERVPVERLFEVYIAPIDLAGVPRIVMLTLRDLSEIRRVERMRVDFVANVSHELRTPLTSVLCFVETLQGPARNDPAARDRFLAIMGEQARRMSRLVDDLLSLSPSSNARICSRPRLSISR